IKIGDLELPLPRDGLLRLAGAVPDRRSTRTVSAAEIVDHAEARQRVARAVVLIAGSAPELGGLRETPNDLLVPSVEIQAQAIEQILSRRAPQAIPVSLELGLTLVMGLIALVVASPLVSPLAGVL